MNTAVRLINIVLVTLSLNAVWLVRPLGTGMKILLGIAVVIYFLTFNVVPSLRKYPTFRLRVMGDGAEIILAFLISLTVSLPVAIMSLVQLIMNFSTDGMFGYVLYLILLCVGEAVLFWNGILRVYLTSVQLGLRYRVLGLVLGWVPVANLVMLLIIYTKVVRECRCETEKAQLNEQRKEQRICATKYPLLMVHGVFFRDSRLLNYWGRVPAELERNGAVVYYGEQQSADSVENCARELARRIEQIVEETGCEKVNIIAHSKGGLDSRRAISAYGADKYVASLTTINTPHRGCLFAEYLLGAAPEKLVNKIESVYNEAFHKLGDPDPDFLAAVKDLTNSAAEHFNETTPDAEGILYQSCGSKAARARSGRFPLNISYPVVKHFDGENDGLVAMDSMKWGESFTPLIPTGKRGITHADVIDLNREDFSGFDVREFYVQLVAGLKERGL